MWRDDGGAMGAIPRYDDIDVIRNARARVVQDACHVGYIKH
jgi:hypothetical protein